MYDEFKSDYTPTSSTGASPAQQQLPLPPILPYRNHSGTSTPTSPPRSASPSTQQFHPAHSRRRSNQSTILTPEDPIILTIRETLYAALADVLSRVPAVKRALATDPPRAYFSSVGLAILEVALYNITPDGRVRGVLGRDVTLEECPPGYQRFMRELVSIGERIMEVAEEDDNRAMQLAAIGEDIPEPRIDRLKRMLERGAGVAEQEERRHGRLSPEGTTMQLANRLNALALGMTRLDAFKERQDFVFKILAGARVHEEY
jgi:hypothetical protein